MKKLATVTKIGQSALVRLYKPHSIYNAMEQSERSVFFPKEQYNLETKLKANHHSSHEYSIQANSGRSYEVWGIEIGRHFIEVLDGDNALNAIARLQCLKSADTPSHFIVHEWSSNDVSGDRETYTVYRLSQKQESVIKRRVNEQLVKIAHSN